MNIFEGIHFDNNSTQTGAGVNGATTPIRVKNCKMSCSDKNDNGFYLATEDSYVKDVHFVGGGSNCGTAMAAIAGEVNNLRFTGTWWTSGYPLSLNGTTVRAGNIVVECSGNFFIGGVVANIWHVSGSPNFIVGTIGTKVSNAKTSRPWTINANIDDVHLIGVQGSNLTIGAGADDNVVVGNFTGTASIDGANNRVQGLVAGQITVETNATFAVVDCHTDQAITDNGTGTVDRVTVY